MNKLLTATERSVMISGWSSNKAMLGMINDYDAFLESQSLQDARNVARTLRELAEDDRVM